MGLVMFLKQNINNYGLSCERCEWLCEPFRQIITTLKAFLTNAFSPHVNDVNHFFARAREEKNNVSTNFDHKTINNEITLTREKYIKSFTSFTCNLNYCLYLYLYVNHFLKSFTRSFTSFTCI